MAQWDRSSTPTAAGLITLPYGLPSIAATAPRVSVGDRCVERASRPRVAQVSNNGIDHPILV